MPVPHFQEGLITLYCGNSLAILSELPAESVQCVVTSPPYWGLRDYGVAGQIGLEETPKKYLASLVDVFREVNRILKTDGTLWLNLGDSYSHGGHGARDPEKWPKQSRNDHHPTHGKTHTGLKAKDLIGIPWLVAFALQADGWYLRSDIIWSKPNPMPESVSDRPTKAHEYLFLLSKSQKYWYDAPAISEPAKGWNGSSFTSPSDVSTKPNLGNGPRNETGSRNRRDVWTIPLQPFPDAHFATFPEDLVTPCILAGARRGDTILDPFAGAATVGLVARRNGNPFIGIELNPEYCEIAARRLRQSVFAFDLPSALPPHGG